MATTHLLYLHGFRSSPQSTKAQLMAAHVRTHHPKITWWCPQLPPSPQAAAQLIEQGTANWPQAQMAVIGSSLGGYYATWLANRTGCRAVLLNPAVDPARDLAAHIGQLHQWQNPEETFDFKAEYIDQLRTLHAGKLNHPERLLAIIAQGDEVLDWREMTTRYANAQQIVIEGGDHALSNLEEHIGSLDDFLLLKQITGA